MYMTLHLGIYCVEIILIQSTSYPHTYDLKVIQIADLIIIIIIILSRKKMKTQPGENRGGNKKEKTKS